MLLKITEHEWLHAVKQTGFKHTGPWLAGDVQRAWRSWVKDTRHLRAINLQPEAQKPARSSRLHLHRWRELREVVAWSRVLDREVLVSAQRCRCGHDREVVRARGLLGKRTLRIRMMPQGAWDTLDGADS
jgi:hypothetical protein